MPTIKVVLRNADTEGKVLTKRYPNAHAHVNPTTHILYVYRRQRALLDSEEMLAEFQPDTYLYWH
jgi:hypothetical protein